MTAPFSVIIPVFNEANVLRRTVPTLLQELHPEALLIYVCNGCTDGSAEIIRSIAGNQARVLEIDKPGKPNAIRLGEEFANTVFPRFFVDADVTMAGRAFPVLVQELSKPGVEMISPRCKLDTDGCSYAAKSIATVWHRLPYMQQTGVRVVIGVTRQGRSRWAELPDVIADDSFMASQIPYDRRRVITSVLATERVPRTYWSFIGVRARWLMGDWQLKKMGLTPNHPSQRAALQHMLFTPQTFLPAAIYLSHRLLASVLAKWRTMTGQTHWFRDQSSR